VEGSGRLGDGELELDHEGRLGEVESLEDAPLARGGLGPLAAGAGGAAEDADVHAVELVAEVAPGVLTVAFSAMHIGSRESQQSRT
jgi:hypothetical protein